MRRVCVTVAMFPRAQGSGVVGIDLQRRCAGIDLSAVRTLDLAADWGS